MGVGTNREFTRMDANEGRESFRNSQTIKKISSFVRFVPFVVKLIRVPSRFPRHSPRIRGHSRRG